MSHGIASNFEYRQPDAAPEYPAWCRTLEDRKHFDWCVGFDLEVDGEPFAACRNDSQRRGYRASEHAAGYNGMNAKQLEALGV